MREFANFAQCLIVFAQARLGRISASLRRLRVTAACRRRRAPSGSTMRPWRAALPGLNRLSGPSVRASADRLRAHRRGTQALEPAAAMENAAGTLGRLSPESSFDRPGPDHGDAEPSRSVPIRGWALQKLHPALDFEIIAERGRVSLPRHQSDIALRLEGPSVANFRATRCRVGYGFYCDRVWRDRLKKGISPFSSVSTKRVLSFRKPYGWPGSFVARGSHFAELPDGQIAEGRGIRHRHAAVFSRGERLPWSSCG